MLALRLNNLFEHAESAIFFPPKMGFQDSLGSRLKRPKIVKLEKWWLLFKFKSAQGPYTNPLAFLNSEILSKETV